MGLLYFTALLVGTFFAAYFATLGIIKWVHGPKKPVGVDLHAAVGVTIALPIILATAFLDFWSSSAFLFTGVATFALISFFISLIRPKTEYRIVALFITGLLASYLIPGSLFTHGFIVNTLMHAGLAAGLTGWVYLFKWMDRIPFMSMTTSLAFAILIFFFSQLMGALPNNFATLGLIVVAGQMGASMSIKPVAPFKLGKSASYAIGFIWGFIGMYLAAGGFVVADVFMAGYYLLELCFVLIMTFVAYKAIGLKTPTLVEKAIATHFQVARVFKVVLLYTIAMGLIGFWFARVPSPLFLGAGVLFLGYMWYQFRDWTNRPTYKNVIGDLKGGYKELKNDIIALKDKVQDKTEKPAAKTPKTKTKPVVKQSTVAKKATPVKRAAFSKKTGKKAGLKKSARKTRAKKK